MMIRSKQLPFINFNALENVREYFRYQSGYLPPGDIDFEDLSKMDPEPVNTSRITNRVMNSMTLKATISAHKLKKRPGIFSMFTSNKVRKLICLAPCDGDN